MDREGRPGTGLEPYVKRNALKTEAAAVVDGKPKFSRQGVEGSIARQPAFQACDDWPDVEDRGWIDAGQRAGDDVADGLGSRAVVEQASLDQRIMQGWQVVR